MRRLVEWIYDELAPVVGLGLLSFLVIIWVFWCFSWVTYTMLEVLPWPPLWG